jgi:hypothetical protein
VSADPVVLVGVPDSVPETEPPLPVPALNDTPFGNWPDSLRVGVGSPGAVTVKENASLGGTVSFAAVVNTGAVGAVELTISVNGCENEPALLVAVNVIG